MTTKTDQLEPTFDTESAKRVLENERLDRQNRAARRLQEFVNLLRQEENCVVVAVPYVTQDGRLDAQIAINALPPE